VNARLLCIYMQLQIDFIRCLHVYVPSNARYTNTILVSSLCNQGGREVEGLLKGFDKLDNLVLDDCTEYLRDPEDQYRYLSCA
jgi:small nuclear ribonucleoprotein (snRNP)-like protein